MRPRRKSGPTLIQARQIWLGDESSIVDVGVILHADQLDLPHQFDHRAQAEHHRPDHEQPGSGISRALFEKENRSDQKNHRRADIVDRVGQFVDGVGALVGFAFGAIVGIEEFDSSSPFSG